jgi:hypothetical protein
MILDGAYMRILKTLSGIAVLLNALHLIHAIHHFYSLEPIQGFGLWVGLAFAATTCIFSFIGGYFLLKQDL